jgi:hypothetical protein
MVQRLGRLLGLAFVLGRVKRLVLVRWLGLEMALVLVLATGLVSGGASFGSQPMIASSASPMSGVMNARFTMRLLLWHLPDLSRLTGLRMFWIQLVRRAGGVQDVVGGGLVCLVFQQVSLHSPST